MDRNTNALNPLGWTQNTFIFIFKILFLFRMDSPEKEDHHIGVPSAHMSTHTHTLLQQGSVISSPADS